MPADAISVRLVVQKAAAAQSSIHYHFGDMERLYLAAAGTALREGQAWMEAQLMRLGALAGEPLSAELQGSLIASTIADWTAGQRRLAMAWRHAPDAEWQAAWDGFWRRLATILGLGEHADCIACFAAGEAARHLLVWNPLLDRALLEETAATLTLWLSEQRRGTERVRPTYRTLAQRGYNVPVLHLDGSAPGIADAAAGLLADKGHAGVTFRAVANQAGVTLGKVIHVFGTKSALLHAALHSLYAREALGGDPDQLLVRTFAPEAMLERLLEAVIGRHQPVLTAYDEIERAIYNGDDYVSLRGLVRAMEDPSGTWALQQMLGGMRPDASLVAVFSAVIRGVGYRAVHGRLDEDELQSGARMALRPFLL
ncbi:TetR family transcriptional regulator [Altererythrobacter sp. H2]|uniref:TetR family transcriptional regulator n=1 Tax=Altererythrobacter sp. H2 TaxID=3108391 RepID=UPI002B4BF597|nr:TetR family transcriptional regulator [Altererythrobacter sp. H2]WRK95140.1 TetR family transcriptional regulator [Altererythrobacter sp. H2]